MDAAGGRDRTLERIVAILLSLALLAERAAGRSFPVRWLVLRILGRAEAVAAFLFEQRTGLEWPCRGEPGESGNAPTDALVLAARLRMLAAFLAALAADAGCIRGRALPDAAAGLPAPYPILVFVVRGGLKLRPLDSS